MRKAFLTTLLCGFLAGCNGFSDISEAPRIESVWPGDPGGLAKVFYLTDRNREKGPVKPYRPRSGWHGESWSPAPSCGTIDVSIAKTDLLGKAPVYAQMADPVEESGICAPPEPGEVTDKNSTFQAFINSIKTAATRGCVFLYVQGYNNTFDTAITRTGQLASDTRRGCAAVAFSWSSAGQVDRYVTDVEHSSYAVPLLRALLIALKNAPLRIEIVAHSMGTRLTLQTLATMKHLCRERPFISEIVFAAPDIGEEIGNNDFLNLEGAVPDDKNVLAPIATSCAMRTTLYVSGNDSVLAASKTAHGGMGRVGRDPTVAFQYQTMPADALTIARGTIDVVDASDAPTPGDSLGHDYFSNSYEVMSDMILALQDVPAVQRTAGTSATLAEDCAANCASAWPRFTLIVKDDRKQRPSWLGRTIRDLIPLSPAGQ